MSMKHKGDTLTKGFRLFPEILYIIILLIYPIIGADQGVSPVDPTYSLANFRFFNDMSGTWIIATFLANAVGHLLMCLPGASCFLGMNIYTSLIVGLIAVSAYLFLRSYINVHILFVSELLALGLCSCPSVLLYNYLTYLFFTLAALFVYTGLLREDDRWLIAAGIILGVNVFVRLPNVTECALILAVWYDGVRNRRKPASVAMSTVRCIAGFLAGVLCMWIWVALRYSPAAYIDMIRNMFAMTDTAVDYKPVSMIGGMFEDYLYAGRWILMWLGGLVICAVVYILTESLAHRGDSTGAKIRLTVRGVVMVCVFGVILRICYGQGMFFFRYYEYGSVYFLTVVLLCMVTIAALVMAVTTVDVLSVIVLIVMYVTCIGSNNGLYPIMNNLFIVAPYTGWLIYRGIRSLHDAEAGVTSDEGAKTGTGKTLAVGSVVRAFEAAATALLSVLMVCTLIQSLGFHAEFEFGDGVWGEPRDAVITGHRIVDHMHTTSANAESLQGLMDYMDGVRSEGDTLLAYDELPGLGYLLDMPPALSTFWPDLRSYNYYEWERDLKYVRHPVIIVSLETAAWMDGDDDVIDYYGIDREKFASDRKLADLAAYIRDEGYVQTYTNDLCSVYIYSYEE